MPIPKDFPSTAELVRVKKEHELYDLYACREKDPDENAERFKFRLREFFGDSLQKCRVLDVALNVAPIIVEAGTDFLFGEPPTIKMESEAEQKKIDEIISRNNLIEKLTESCDLAQAVGHTHFKLYAKDGKAVIEEVPFNNWFPEFAGVPMGGEPKNNRIVSYMTAESDGGRQLYIYVEDRYLEGGNLVVEHSLFKDQGGKTGQQVSVDLIGLNVGAVSENGLSRIERTTYPELMTVTVNLRKTVNERFGRSTLERVKTLLYQLNDRVTQVSLEFLKHLNAKMQIPEGSVTRDPKTGAINVKDIDVFLAKSGDPDAKYITNDNPLIEAAFVSMENLVRKICKITKTPDRFLSDEEKGGVERVDALKIQLIQFLKRESLLQTKYERVIRELLRLAYLIEGGTLPEAKITFSVGMPKDWEADGRVWGDALAQGLASSETAVGRFQNLEGAPLAEELARIKKEADERQKSMLAQMGDIPDGEDEE